MKTWIEATFEILDFEGTQYNGTIQQGLDYKWTDSEGAHAYTGPESQS